MIKLTEYQAVLSTFGITETVLKLYEKAIDLDAPLKLKEAVAENMKRNQLTDGYIFFRDKERAVFHFTATGSDDIRSTVIKLNAYGRRLKFREVVGLGLAEGLMHLKTSKSLASFDPKFALAA